MCEHLKFATDAVRAEPGKSVLNSYATIASPVWVGMG